MKRAIAVVVVVGAVLNVLFWGMIIGAKGPSKEKRASVEMLDPVARGVVRQFREKGRLPDDAEFAADLNSLSDRIQYSKTASNIFTLSCTDAHYGPVTRKYTISETNLTAEMVIGR
jgi:hypothetical protein